jgi:hypothetical protein
MNGADFVETVRERNRMELGRLASDKAIIAVTGANLETDAVLRAAARAEVSARDSFETWADEESGDAGDLFERIAGERGEAAEAILADLDVSPEDVDDPVVAALGERTDAIGRVGATVGYSLVREAILLQTVNFFINEADRSRADQFRAHREHERDRIEDGATVLESLCDGEEDWEHAIEAATAVISTAYEDYANTLEAMGVNPKPVC